MAPTEPHRLQLVALDVPDAGVLRVLVRADDPLARVGLVALFSGQAGYAVTGSLGAGDDLAAAVSRYRPDVLLWDLGATSRAFPDADDVSEAALPVLALVPGEERAAEAWAGGARGLLLRNAAPSMMAAALVALHHGLVVVDPDLADAVLALRPARGEGEALTAREQEVLALLAEGLPNKLVADRLGISESTAKFHVAAILGKLGVHSRTEAVLRGARLGLLLL